MKAVKVNGKKYIPNVEVFKIHNKWVLANEAALNTFTNKMELLSRLEAYIDLDNKIKYSTNLISIELPSGKIISICKSKEELYKNELIVHPTNSNRYIILDEKYSIPIHEPFRPNSKIYSVVNSAVNLQPYTELENNLKFLEKYTFGVELETVGIPLNKQDVNNLGFHELYDGSIVGPEYATGVMKYNNFHHLEYFLKLLKTVSRHDHSCSLHIHVGNVEYTPEKLAATYSLFQRLQEDLNLLIAPYKKDYKFLANKQKDHCQNLPLIPDINEYNIKHLFKIPNDISKRDLNEYITRTSKWNLSGRYHTVNFLNYICKTFPNNTIELRSLQMTFNYDYVLTWLIINTAIIDYATSNAKIILDKKQKIQIEDCLTHFVKDSELLELVLNNYYNIKNTIYNKKYLNNDYSTNSMALDDNLKNLNTISSNFNIDKKCYRDLSNIDNNLIMDLKLKVTSNHIELPPIKVVLDGNYLFPNRSTAESILDRIVQELIKLNLNKTIEIEPDKKYILRDTNIITKSKVLYNGSNTKSYIIIDNNEVFHKIEDGDRSLTVKSWVNITNNSIKKVKIQRSPNINFNISPGQRQILHNTYGEAIPDNSVSREPFLHYLYTGSITQNVPITDEEE